MKVSSYLLLLRHKLILITVKGPLLHHNTVYWGLMSLIQKKVIKFRVIILLLEEKALSEHHLYLKINLDMLWKYIILAFYYKWNIWCLSWNFLFYTTELIGWVRIIGTAHNWEIIQVSLSLKFLEFVLNQDNELINKARKRGTLYH